MNDTTLACLRAVGWTPERRVDLTRAEARLRAKGWTLHAAGRAFLASFNGLPEFRHADLEPLGFSREALTFDFGYGSGIDSRDLIAPIERTFGLSLVPVGHQDLFDLFLDEAGRIHSIDADQMCLRLGHTPGESLDNLFTGRYVEELKLT